MHSKRNQSLLQFGLFCGIVLFINILASFFYTHFDLTEEKRFTLTRPTKALLKAQNDRIFVKVLLEGNFPAGFKRLQTATREMLDDFRSESSNIDYEFEDPNKGTVEEINERRKSLAQDGVIPVNLRVHEEGESSQKVVYPVAIFHFGTRKISVKLLENESASLNPDAVINNSVSLLEYKFANAIKKLRTPTRPVILFTRGHGELEPLQTGDLERSLHQFYDTDHILLDSMVQLKKENCEVLIIAKPRTAFSEKDKFKIDQYIMNGGKALWLIDRMGVTLDSLQKTGRFVPNDYPLNIEDQLFKYGVRIQPDLVVDIQCTKIPLRVGQVGNAPQYDLFAWPYHLAVSPSVNHPIVKNLDRVELDFCSSIDTIRTKTPVKKTIVLQSSKYSRLQFSPADLNFEIVKYDLEPAKFDKGRQTVGVVLEGIFASNYENRVSEEMNAGMAQMGLTFKNQSVPTRMMVISDGDIAANFVKNAAKKEWLPLGFNRYESSTYSNKDLLLNAIEYLIEADGVIEARTKEVKLRLLDDIKAKKEKTMWQLVNIIVPLLFLGLFGFAFRWWRRRKYAS
jgi:ABC-2 type transport system permease protein